MKAPATLDNEAAANVKISASLPAFCNLALSFFFGESALSFSLFSLLVFLLLFVFLIAYCIFNIRFFCL